MFDNFKLNRTDLKFSGKISSLSGEPNLFLGLCYMFDC